MRFTIQCEYTHSFVPPRCRSVRQEKRIADIELEIKEVGEGDAPIAIKTRDEFCEWSHLRWYNGSLWRATGKLGQETCDTKDILGLGHTGHMERDAVQEMCSRKCDHVLVVGGEVYLSVEEPVLVVVTFGLGRGTALAINSLSSVSRNLPNRAFGFNEIDRAVCEAIAVAESRQDLNSIPSLKGMLDMYDVLIPEAFAFSGLAYRVKIYQDRINELSEEVREMQSRIDEIKKDAAEFRSWWDGDARSNG